MELTDGNDERLHPSLRRLRLGVAAVIGALSAQIAACVWPSGAAAQSLETAGQMIGAGTPVAIAFMLSILALKITAFVLGYHIVKLGHDTLIKGVSGQLDFGFSGSGFKAKLKAASPGALFVLMGAAIIIWGLTVQKPMEIKMVPAVGEPAPAAQTTGGDKTRRAPVPD